MKIIEIPPFQLDEYAQITISFEVSKIFDVTLIESGLGGIELHERSVSPYLKDYDLYGSPLSWPVEFEINNWGIFLAMEDDKPIGGAAVAWKTNNLDMLEDRQDLTVLWDLRVLPEVRRRGAGRSLFEFAAEWSRARNCAEMKVETQNINVDACRFYAAMGAELGEIRRFAYSKDGKLKHETQLIWYKKL